MGRIDIKNLLDAAGGCILAPSILSADFTKLGEECDAAKNAGADMLHLDIMDGYFVPNITFGPPVVKSIIGTTSLPMDAHLMINNPMMYGKIFVEMGVDIITAHIEVLPEKSDWIKFRDSMNTIVGIAINPPTPINNPDLLVEHFDLILPMSVNPGFSGQEFIFESLPKIEAVAESAERMGLVRIIAVDGGINPETVKLVRNAGANMIVAGNAFFKSKNYAKAVKELKEI